jgi:hypothetical protein
MNTVFEKRLNALETAYTTLVTRKNEKEERGNGIYDGYRYPVLTANHAPLFWRYADANHQSEQSAGFKTKRTGSTFSH